MGIRRYNPTSPGRRFQTALDYSQITTDKPYKPLLKKIKKTGGRNNRGKVTAWHRGGGNKRLYRIIDFKRNIDSSVATVETVEYDPNRSAHICLVKYEDGTKKYIIAPEGIKVNDVIESGPKSEIKVGNTLQLKDIPLGTVIHNLELKPGQGAKLVRSAGAQAQLLAKDNEYAHIKLPSGEVRLLSILCKATLGQVSNAEHENVSIGKAGRKRWKGRKPIVRGVVMNPIDHPLGGGEGRSSGGRSPCSPWGKPEGVRTRKNKKTDKYIVKRRK